MRNRRFTVALAASLLLGACTDTSGPSGDLLSPHLGGDLAVENFHADGTLHILTQAADAPVLESLEASAYVVRGERQRIRIRYDADPEGPDQDDALVTFVELEFDKQTLLFDPDGARIPVGDSVLVTVSVHPYQLRVTLEPSGLTFSPARPARLKIKYHHADRDLDGDDGIDIFDELIRKVQLGLWLQDDATGNWSRILDARHSEGSRKIEARLRHFSNYAVGW